MSRMRLFTLLSLLLVSGCLWPVCEKTDRQIAVEAAHPFDVGPEQPADAGKAAVPASNAPGKLPPSAGRTPAETPAAANKPAARSFPAMDVQTTSFMQPAEQPARPSEILRKFELQVPTLVPGSEAPLIKLPADRAAKEAEVRRIYPLLPPLPEEPTPLPGPNGQPFTLADLQRVAAENSPTLRQAASDVEAAKGNVIAARAYPNPTFAFETDPNNASSSPGAFGFYIDQVIKTAGKLKLASAAAMMDLANAELALKRARSDLATNVRNAYYGLVVAQETVRVNRALAFFTDEIYRLQADLVGAGQAASYEPAALRAQAYTTRLAYKQSISTYLYSWKQLVATVGLRQLPLSEVAGRVDRLIPAYEYDAALAHALRNHTDVLSARNGIEKARYNLKLAQVTPIPDVDVHVEVAKESTLPPFSWFAAVQVAVPVPIWDQNKGPIIAAQAGLVRALEEPHRVETNLTNNFAAAFVNYKNNIDAVEYYRRNVLPDQVRYYRGVFQRRQIDINASFGDLVQAQQTLAADVSTYLGLLGSLWSSIVTVADFLQTDDLFQQAQTKELPPLPDFSDLPPWPCPHPPRPGDAGCAAAASLSGVPIAATRNPAAAPTTSSAVSAPVNAVRTTPMKMPMVVVPDTSVRREVTAPAAMPGAATSGTSLLPALAPASKPTKPAEPPELTRPASKTQDSNDLLLAPPPAIPSRSGS